MGAFEAPVALSLTGQQLSRERLLAVGADDLVNRLLGGDLGHLAKLPVLRQVEAVILERCPLRRRQIAARSSRATSTTRSLSASHWHPLNEGCLPTARKLRFHAVIGFAAFAGNAHGRSPWALMGLWSAIALNRVGTGAEASAPTSVRLRLSRYASLSLRPLNRMQDERSKAPNLPLIPRPEVRQGAAV